MKFNVITLFPEIYDALHHGLIKKAQKNKLIELNVINLRDFSLNNSGQIDDKQFGGEDGMVLQPEPLKNALQSISNLNASLVINFSPQGEILNQQLVNELSKKNSFVLINGRYEGIDQRFIDKYVHIEISLGDFVLSNGDFASIIFIDALSRLIKGVAKEENSILNDSFYNGLLKGPVYTRPKSFDGKEVPEVLVSGNHKKIAEWRMKESLKTTLKKRPELFDKIKLTKKQRKVLEELQSKLIL